MFKKSLVVGVSVSPENGLEIAQIDYSSGTVIKYGRKSVDYNIVKREINDLDLFKESLQDLLEELNIPKGTELVLNMPTVAFNIADYPVALEYPQVESAIEEELYENPYLKNYEPCYSYVTVSSSLQFNKIAYTALNKTSMIELALSIKAMGYKVSAIDTSVNSVLHALVYLGRVNTEPDTNWVLLTIDNSCCRILSMLGRDCIEVIEEKISIGEVLSDAENYATVISAVEPILKNFPAKYLCVVSKTNVISAEVLSNKLSYSAQIIYQEANCYLKEPLMNLSNLVEEEYEKMISLDVIGAAIYQDYAKTTNINFNLFNKTLGDIFLMEQPPILFNGKVVLSNSFLFSLGIVIAAIIAIIVIAIYSWLSIQNNMMRANIADMEAEIARINQYIERHKELSSASFDEGDEIRLGLAHNKNVYSYYTIVGTEIPQKLWLTHLKLGNKTTIEGQADNLESIYAFFRSIKDYNPKSNIKLQNLGLASVGPKELNSMNAESDSVLTTLDADFYEFKISDDITPVTNEEDDNGNPNQPSSEKKSKKSGSSSNSELPNLEVISE